jgi:bis(5'-adenosyl)-triphosphatase
MTQRLPTKAKDCIFCKKSVTGKAFYSDPQFSAIYNIAPILPGHTLIIPNIHHESLSCLSDTELGDMMIFARKITSVLITFFRCEGFDWTIQDGISAGQTVPHLHLHIVPRRLKDLPEGEEWYDKIKGVEPFALDSQNRPRLTEQEYIEISSSLSAAARKMIK